jgi:hypothetical protein
LCSEQWSVVSGVRLSLSLVIVYLVSFHVSQRVVVVG